MEYRVAGRSLSSQNDVSQVYGLKTKPSPKYGNGAEGEIAL